MNTVKQSRGHIHILGLVFFLFLAACIFVLFNCFNTIDSLSDKFFMLDKRVEELSSKVKRLELRFAAENLAKSNTSGQLDSE